MTIQGQTVIVSKSIDLDAATCTRVFESYLEQLKGDRFIRNGKLWEDMYTSHRFDSECDDQSDFQLIQTIERLQAILKERT